MARAASAPADDARLAFALASALLVGAIVARATRADRRAGPLVLSRHVVDLDEAGAGEIETLPGVGPVLAERVVAERARRPFADVDDLARVPGLGPATLSRLREFVRCGRGLSSPR
jgi:DNA uptake protein ComE-like DNA-binding protein